MNHLTSSQDGLLLVVEIRTQNYTGVGGVGWVWLNLECWEDYDLAFGDDVVRSLRNDVVGGKSIDVWMD